MNPRRHTLRDLGLLTLLCLVTYFPGLTTHGLTNWQEAQRAVVAREMQARGDWLVPTINGRPYLAKPPLIYWSQLGLAKVVGDGSGSRRVGLLHLRLTVALAGLAGVLATYLVAHRLLDDDPNLPAPTQARASHARWSRTAALWSAITLATGILYVRSSRIGELDILLVPFVVIGIGAIAAAWRTHRERGRTNYPAFLLAAACAVGAALTKGPPGLLALGLAGYGGIALWHLAEASARRGDAPARSSFPWPTALVILAGLAAFVVALGNAGPGDSLGTTLPGSLLIAGAIAALTHLALGVLRPSVGKPLFIAYSRTHPVGVLGAGAAALWLWGSLVRARIGDGAATLVSEETEDNLRLLVPVAPLNNLEAAAFGVGLGSLAAILGVVWLLKDRPRLRPGWFIVIAWVALGLVAFSLLGKGVGRYLTPLWPGIAILGGMFLAAAVIDARRPRLLTLVLATSVALLSLSQSWYYGYGREMLDADRSPRALVAQLRAPPLAVEPASIITFEFRTPALDYELDRWVPSVGETGLRPGIAGGESWTLDELYARVRDHGPVTLLIRTREPPGKAPAIDRLRAAGFTVEPLPTSAAFTIDAGKAPIAAVRITR
jgi:4-amino-4-deoxy-L-arabinose transferase-like glycosyltransferase